jgi:UDP-3-O-[3-hydroxymyristoyl] glucosamine N-acyltransferase
MVILASELATKLGGTLIGRDCKVSRLAPVEQPSRDSVVVVSDEKTLSGLEPSEATLLVVSEKITQATPHSLIKVRDTRLALAQLTQLFDTRPQGIHPSAVIHASARLENDVHVAENVVIQANAVVGKGSRIGPGCVIGENVTLGENCLLHPNVTLYANIQLGQRVILHSGSVIGSDGFGYAPGPRGAVKIHHLDTVLGDRTKIDNLCQIGHNVQMGSDCLMAGRGAVAGSVKIGNRVTIGGSVGIADHITIGDGATLAAGSGVSKDIPAGETWAGAPAVPFKKWVRGLYLQGQLETMWRLVKELKSSKGEGENPR